MENDTPTEPSKKPDESQAAPEATPPSLEQIASEFPVDEQATQFQANTQPAAKPLYEPTTPTQVPPVTDQQAQQYAPTIPDPVLDAEGYRRYMHSQSVLASQIQGSLRTMEQRLANFEQTQQQSKVDADVNQAVLKVNEKLKVDPMLAEIALEKMYRSDASFAKIWDNRAKNPQAFEKALGIVADKLAPMFQVRQDPQLTENQRAAQASQRSMASTPTKEYDPRLKGLYEPESQGEFDQAWEAFKRGMSPG